MAKDQSWNKNSQLAVVNEHLNNFFETTVQCSLKDWDLQSNTADKDILKSLDTRQSLFQQHIFQDSYFLFRGKTS